MTRSELKRIRVLQRHLDKLLTIREVSEDLGISQRQVYRLKRKYIELGEEALAHGNRGRKPAIAISNSIKEQVVHLYQRKEYSETNFSHFTELFNEQFKRRLSVSTVRNILSSHGMRSPKALKRRPKRSFPRRERRSQRGMLLQIDASHHYWLGKDRPSFALFAAIDDATGLIESAIFRPTEDLKGYLEIINHVVKTNGTPMSIYSDKHTIFRSPKEQLTIDEQLQGTEIPLSQFGKALKDLGIEHIKAQTPQAKGRVERLFGTLQDRMVQQFKIAGVTTIKQANKLLPKLIKAHNDRFSVAPKNSQSAYHGVIPKRLEQILCFRYGRRKVDAGNTFSYKGHHYVVKAFQNLNHKEVEVCQTLKGDWFIRLNNGETSPATRCLTKRHAKKSPIPKAAKAAGGYHKPSPQHDWRKFKPNKTYKCQGELTLHQTLKHFKAKRTKK